MPRISIVDRIHFQPNTEEDARSFDAVNSKLVSTDEQVYERPSAKASKDWKPVDFGWLQGKPCYCLVIKNAEATNRRLTIPTEKERKEAEARAIQIKTVGSDVIIAHLLLGESIRLTRPPREGLLIRGNAEDVRYTLCAMPDDDEA